VSQCTGNCTTTFPCRFIRTRLFVRRRPLCSCITSASDDRTGSDQDCLGSQEAAEQRQQEGGAKPRTILPPGIICPDNPRYLAFWYITIAAAAWTGVIKAYTIAFEPPPSKQ